DVDELPLADGRFRVRLGLTDEEGERVFHWLDDALEFIVYPGGDSRGVVRLEGRWSGEGIPPQAEKGVTVTRAPLPTGPRCWSTPRACSSSTTPSPRRGCRRRR